MKQLSWDLSAHIYLFGRNPVFSGTLGSCIEYWQHHMSALGQNTSYITIATSDQTVQHLERDEIAKLAANTAHSET